MKRFTNLRFTTVFLFTIVAGLVAFRYESAAVGVMVAAAGVASGFIIGGEAKDAYTSKNEAKDS